MISRIVAVGILVSVLGAGCSMDNPVESANEPALSENLDNFTLEEGAISDDVLARWRHRDPVMFEVRVENVSTMATLPLSTGGSVGVPLSPGTWALTRARNPLFKVGSFDPGLGMEQLAEDGDPSILAASLAGKRGVKALGVFNTPEGAGSPAPAFPGESYVFTVEAKPGDFLSLATMFVQSNDLFYSPGVFGIPLFNWYGQPKDGDVTHRFYLWDAGTEVNQEPGLGPDQAPRQAGPNTGETEHKRAWFVHDGYDYPSKYDVIKVTITPVAGA